MDSGKGGNLKELSGLQLAERADLDPNQESVLGTQARIDVPSPGMDVISTSPPT